MTDILFLGELSC